MAWFKIPLARSPFDDAQHLEALKRFYERWMLADFPNGAAMYRTSDRTAKDQSLFFSVSDTMRLQFIPFFHEFCGGACTDVPFKSIEFVVGKE